MAKFDRLDWQAMFQDMARAAQSKAGVSADPGLRQVWTHVSERWEYLARLYSERCFCGRAAIGAKYYRTNARMPFCGDHLTEAITQDVLFRMNARRLN